MLEDIVNGDDGSSGKELFQGGGWEEHLVAGQCRVSSGVGERELGRPSEVCGFRVGVHVERRQGTASWTRRPTVTRLTLVLVSPG